MLIADIGRAGVVGALGVTLFVGLPPLWVVAALAALTRYWQRAISTRLTGAHSADGV